MAGRNRAGYTLRELIVILAVVGLAVAIGVPAFMAAKEMGRRANCMGNHKQFGLALINYEGRHRAFPGYVNRIPSTPGANYIVAGWLPAILPQIDRSDLYQLWCQGTPKTEFLRMTVCPSDVAQDVSSTSTAMSYVVNCGLPGDDNDSPDTGIFHNHHVANPVLVGIDYISQHDGTAVTLLLSENIQAGKWTDTSEADLGMVWHREPESCNYINGSKDVGKGLGDIRYARPSSYHGGGAVASFCDGHVSFLSESIDYRVYQHMMTPFSHGAGLPDDPRQPYDF
jgi:prepilin-type processing-associated H-X9-DG protein